MADLTNSPAAGDESEPRLADIHDHDGTRPLTVPHLMELDLDGPTLEMLLAALTVGDCDQVGSAEG